MKPASFKNATTCHFIRWKTAALSASFIASFPPSATFQLFLRSYFYHPSLLFNQPWLQLAYHKLQFTQATVFSLKCVFTLQNPTRPPPPPLRGAALIGSEHHSAVCCCTAAMTTSTDDASRQRLLPRFSSWIKYQFHSQSGRGMCTESLKRFTSP